MIEQFDVEETIVALATAREPGYPKGIIRVSGPQTKSIVSQSFHPSDPGSWEGCRTPRMFVGTLTVAGFDAKVPVEVLFWPNARSYTRQVSAEIHAPGSIPVLDGILQQLCENGARLARPGEFTMRAFLSGRLDLTEAEAVLGVIDAHDQKQLDVALRQLSGGLAEPLQQSRTELLTVLAHLEAGLDFVEEDIEFISTEQLLQQLDICQSVMQTLEQKLKGRDQSESRIRIALFGLPNTGKSSLFNALVNRFGKTQAEALVSDVSGTTRDFVSARLDLGGIEVLLVDTAGVEDDPVPEGEQSGFVADAPLEEGQRRSRQQQVESSITLFCLDSNRHVSQWEKTQLQNTEPGRIVCLNKADLPTALDWTGNENFLSVSSQTGEGLNELAAEIFREITSQYNGESIPSTAVRCTSAVKRALDSLTTARDLASSSAGDEIVASEIRIALDAIGEISGVVYTDDILDVVFKQFCIGK